MTHLKLTKSTPIQASSSQQVNFLIRETSEGWKRKCEAGTSSRYIKMIFSGTRLEEKLKSYLQFPPIPLVFKHPIKERYLRHSSQTQVEGKIQNQNSLNKMFVWLCPYPLCRSFSLSQNSRLHGNHYKLLTTVITYSSLHHEVHSKNI